MADYDEQRRRTTRSFFPAVNNALATGARATPYNSVYSQPNTFGGTSSGIGPPKWMLPPDQNPAYQAAIAKGRPSRGGYTMIQTPSGGSMSVPKGQEQKYTDLLYKNNPTADTGFQRPNPQAAYALGNTGAVPTGNTPYEQSFRMGAQGEGPVNPAPSTGLGYRIGQFASNAIPGIAPLAQNVASSVANYFKGGNTMAQSPYLNQNSALASVQNFQQSGQFNLQPTQPRRYFDPASNYNF